MLAEQRRRAAVHRAGLTGEAERERHVRARTGHRVLDLFEEATVRGAGRSRAAPTGGRRWPPGRRRPRASTTISSAPARGAPRRQVLVDQVVRGVAGRGRSPAPPPTAGRRARRATPPLLVGGDGDRHPAMLAEVRIVVGAGVAALRRRGRATVAVARSAARRRRCARSPARRRRSAPRRPSAPRPADPRRCAGDAPARRAARRARAARRSGRTARTAHRAGARAAR